MDSMEKELNIEAVDNIKVEQDINNKISQQQFYELITGKEIGWHEIIYDLIHSEQLDPWDIDLSLLANKYLEKIRSLEEANFILSSKVLLAAALLLRIKSEFLLNKYIRSIDDILFGKKDDKKKPFERIVLDENEIPELIPRTPLPRFKKVSLQELMNALDKAINTESRRIKKEISVRREEYEASVVFPKATRVNIKDRIRKIYAKIQTYFKKQHKVSYTDLVGEKAEDRIACFLPVLHLDKDEKIWLHQEKHFDEIWVWLKEAWRKEDDARKALSGEIDDTKEEIDEEQQRRVELINSEFENPLGDFFDLSDGK